MKRRILPLAALVLALLLTGCKDRRPAVIPETSPEPPALSSECSSGPASQEEPSSPDEASECSPESGTASSSETGSESTSGLSSDAGEASSEGEPSEHPSEAALTSDTKAPEQPSEPAEEPKKEEPKKEEPKKAEPGEEPKKEPTEYKDGEYTYYIKIDDYLSSIAPADAGKYLLITNRANPLPNPKSFSPAGWFGEEMVSVDGSSKLVKTAATAMKAMIAEAKKLGVYDSYINNGYRSYDLQSYLYETYKKQEKARHPGYSDKEITAIVDTYSAVPGTSEHHTGLAVDFSPVTSKFEKTKFYRYLQENAHKFGYILRYEQSTIDITGYMEESWHWRFVGREAATYIHAHHITLEEYMEIVSPGKYTRMPTDKRPTKPVSDVSSEPVSEIPSEPVSEIPSGQVSDIPSEVVSDIPSEAASELPSGKTSDLPSEKTSEDSPLPDKENSGDTDETSGTSDP